MTQEEILQGFESLRVMTDADYYEDLWQLGCIEQAMDEYSQQESIAFLEWQRKLYFFDGRFNKYRPCNLPDSSEIMFTTKELYAEFKRLHP